MKYKLQYFSFVCVFWGFCTINALAMGETEHIPQDKLTIAASFDAIKELTEIVGKDKVHVQCIVPAESEAHHFEPKAGDLKFLAKAKVIVYNGLGMEPWLEDATKAVSNDETVYICATRDIIPIKLKTKHHHEEHNVSAAEYGLDPHTWLSLESAIIMVKNISVGLSTADPAHTSFYKKNADAFIAEAETLLHTYRNKFAQLKNKTFVTGHASFGYLCRDFGLEQKSVSGVFASKEPTGQQLAKLTDYCKHHGIKTVFAEMMVSPTVSQTLAKEADAQVERIYTLESRENGLPYMTRMKHNLEKIYTSLK